VERAQRRFLTGVERDRIAPQGELDGASVGPLDDTDVAESRVAQSRPEVDRSPRESAGPDVERGDL
jgi:hypothetical protein